MIQQALKHSWWLFLFIAALFFVYSSGIEKKVRSTELLTKRLSSLMEEKRVVEEEREELLLQIESEKDPAWIEMKLKRRLGLVADEEKKVCFTQNDTKP